MCSICRALTRSFNGLDGRVGTTTLHGWRVLSLHAIRLLGDEVQHVQQHPELLVHFVFVQLGFFDLFLQLFGQLRETVGARHFLLARRPHILLLVVLAVVVRTAVARVVQIEVVDVLTRSTVARLFFFLIALQCGVLIIATVL